MRGMNNSTRSLFILVTAVAATLVRPTEVKAATATALIDNAGTLQLLNFDTATPGTLIGSALTLSGLGVNETLVGIDYRPLDSVLVGLGYNSVTGAAKVYSISLSTGVLTSINANTLTLATGITRLTMDFNPTANAVRVVTSAATSNNLRIPTGGTGVLTTDTDLNPANAGIRATAYSRDNAGGGTSGATTLYEIDGTNNALVSQGSVDFFTGSGGTSPNTGTLTTVGTLTGVTGSAVVGFDIFNALGTAASSPGTAYLATGPGAFLTLSLGTTAASSVGTIGGTYTAVRDIAVQTPVPEPGSLALLGLTALGFAGRRVRARRG